MQIFAASLNWLWVCVRRCTGVSSFFLVIFQAEGPTVRDLKVRFNTGRKTSKNQKKLEKAMKVLKVIPIWASTWMSCYACPIAYFYFIFFAWRSCVQKHKKKNKAEVFNFSALHLIHDPQGRLPRQRFASALSSLTGNILVKTSRRSSWSSWKTPKSALRSRLWWWSSFLDWSASTRYAILTQSFTKKTPN